MKLFDYVKNNLKNNLTSVEFLYQPAHVHLIFFIFKNIVSHMQHSPNHVIDPKNKIALAGDDTISVYVHKDYTTTNPEIYRGFTSDNIIHVVELIKSINALTNVPEDLRIKSLVISRSSAQMIAFHSSKLSSQALLIQPDTMQLSESHLRTLMLRSISSSVLQFDTLTMTQAEEVAMALILSMGLFGMAYNNFITTFIFDLAKQNQYSDNATYLGIIICALIFRVLLASQAKENNEKATQHMHKLFSDQRLIPLAEEPQQNLAVEQQEHDRLLHQIADNTLGLIGLNRYLLN